MNSRFLLIFILFVVFLTSCTFVRIQNVTEAPITVLIVVPDSGGGYTKRIPAGGISETFSAHGGRYTVTMVPGEQYEAILKNLRDVITKRLFEERQTLTSEEVSNLVKNLNQIEKLIEDLSKPGAKCSGYVPDYETAVVIVGYISFEGVYDLSCQSSLN
jgi:hypothetical protein